MEEFFILRKLKILTEIKVKAVEDYLNCVKVHLK